MMNTFHSNIINIYGEKGQAWLNELSEVVTAISSRLDLRDLIEVTNLTYNYVLSGFRGDNPIILKASLDSEGLARETFTLKCFAGYDTVKVLAEDDGIFLLERAVPGTSLRCKASKAPKFLLVYRFRKLKYQATFPNSSSAFNHH